MPAERVGSTYTSIIEVQLALEGAALRAAPAPLLRAATDAGTVAAAKEQVRRQQATLAAVLVGGSATTELQEAARSAAAQLDATIAELDTSALPATRDRYDRTVVGADVDDRRRIEQRTLTAMSRGEPLPAAAGEWDAAAGRTAALIREVELAHQRQLADDAAALAASARTTAWVDGGVVALLVLLTLLVLFLVVRSLARPLHTLRTSAFQIARSRLPAEIERITLVDGRIPDLRVTPIAVDTDEEIGEVARAFDAVHTAAVRLAGEQALLRRSVNDIFVNLAQRSQEHVTRQLHLIDQLKRRGQNSAHLGDLFKLDHVAGMMRRNNENLLVLAGESGRRRPSHARHRRPGRARRGGVGDRAAADGRRRPGAGGRGRGPGGGRPGARAHRAVGERDDVRAAQLTVRVDAWTGSDDGLVVEIVDDGVGMEPSALEGVDADLAEPPLFDPTVSAHMGLFVVGRLARRHGMTVRLRRREAGAGIAASVVVPASVVRHASADDRRSLSPAAGPAARDRQPS